MTRLVLTRLLVPASGRFNPRTCRDCRRWPGRDTGERVFSVIRIFRVNAWKTSIRPGSPWNLRGVLKPYWLPPRRPISLWVMSHAIWIRPAGKGKSVWSVSVRRFAGGALGKIWFWPRLDWFRTQGAHEVTVVTQGNNRAAQRLYQQCGFLSRDLQLWYHKWYPILD